MCDTLLRGLRSPYGNGIILHGFNCPAVGHTSFCAETSMLGLLQQLQDFANCVALSVRNAGHVFCESTNHTACSVCDGVLTLLLPATTVYRRHPM
jgi:hypothetical protein